jgi:hypothetical protein
MKLVRAGALLVALVGASIFPFSSIEAQESGAPDVSEALEALVGSPFPVSAQLSVGAQALRYCDEPTHSVCNAICECLFGGQGGFCIYDPAFTCSLTHCKGETICDYPPV